MWIVATRGTALALVLSFGVLAAACGAATVAESTGASSGSPIVDDGALPVREQLTYSLPVELRDLAGFGDSVIVADLLRVEASYRIVVGEEDTSSAEERVGLVFEITESLFGPGLAAEITVEAAGYQIDPETMERLAILVVDGVSLRDSWKPGDRYVLAVADTDLGFRFRSYALVARVLDDDTLARISTDSVPDELDGIVRLDGLRQFFVALAADG